MGLFSQPSNSLSDMKKIADKIMNERKVKELSSEFKSNTLINALAKDDYTSIQLLICNYLGVLELESIKDLSNQTKKKLLSVIFKTVGFENIRKKLSNVGGKNSLLHTKANLEPIRDLFQELKLTELLKKVEVDLQKAIDKKNK
jgi:hypothetical protein